MGLKEQILIQRKELEVLNDLLEKTRSSGIDDDLIKNLSPLSLDGVLEMASKENLDRSSLSKVKDYFHSLEAMALIAPIKVDLDSIFNILYHSSAP